MSIVLFLLRDLIINVIANIVFLFLCKFPALIARIWNYICFILD